MYKTQMEAAKKGILTKEMKSIAESEAMDEKSFNGKSSKRVNCYSC